MGPYGGNYVGILGQPQQPVGLLGAQPQPQEWGLLGRIANLFDPSFLWDTQGGGLAQFGKHFATRTVPAMAQSAVNAAALPGDVYAGRVDPNSPEAIGRSMDLAGMASLGGGAWAGARPATNQLGIFGGKLAKNAPIDELARAEGMEAAGQSADDIWRATGWGRGADGQWRFEIPDDKAALTPEAARAFEAAPVGEQAYRHNADRVLGHPELHGAYENMAAVDTRLMKGGGYPYRASGRYQVRANGAEEAIVDAANLPDAKSMLLHEYQHAVQQREGFASGGAGPQLPERDIYIARKKAMTLAPDVFKQLNPSGSYASYLKQVDKEAKTYAANEGYRRLAGEVEARNVSKRMDMTPEQRRASPPWTTEDVPRTSQIVRMGGGEGQSMSLPDILGAGISRPATSLPMDETSRMARAAEMGFDTSRTYYHGTTKNLPALESSKSGEFGPGVYLADEPSAATMFGGRSGDDGLNIMPLHHSLRNPFVVSKQDWLAMTRNRSPREVQADLVKRGHDGIVGIGLNGVDRQIVVFDPKNIRSKWAEFDPAKASLPDILSAGGKGGRVAGAAEMAAASGERPGIRAYHGSPHDFDRFDMSKIGTGEGAQAYGHGLYLAENEGVARGYKDRLSQAFTALQGAADLPPHVRDTALSLMSDAQTAPQKLRRMVTKYPGDADALERAAVMVERANNNPGRMYETRINASPDEFLDWDKPLSEQSEGVKSALRAVRSGNRAGEWAFSDKALSGELGNIPASQVLGALMQEGGLDQAGLSQWLKGGIKGIRYKDAGSRAPVAQLQADYDRLVMRGAPEDERRAAWLRLEQAQKSGGTSNYVVFDDKIIDILRKYGIAGLIGGGTAAGAMTAQPGQAEANDSLADILGSALSARGY